MSTEAAVSTSKESWDPYDSFLPQPKPHKEPKTYGILKKDEKGAISSYIWEYLETKNSKVIRTATPSGWLVVYNGIPIVVEDPKGEWIFTREDETPDYNMVEIETFLRDHSIKNIIMLGKMLENQNELAQIKKVMADEGVENIEQLNNMLGIANDYLKNKISKTDDSGKASRGLSFFRSKK